VVTPLLHEHITELSGKLSGVRSRVRCAYVCQRTERNSTLTYYLRASVADAPNPYPDVFSNAVLMSITTSTPSNLSHLGGAIDQDQPDGRASLKRSWQFLEDVKRYHRGQGPLPGALQFLQWREDLRLSVEQPSPSVPEAAGSDLAMPPLGAERNA
jgi:hypothetical protein